MKKKLLLFTVFFALGLIDVSAQNTFNYGAYKPRTLSEIVELNSDIRDADIQIEKDQELYYVLNTDLLHSQVRVTFLDKSRPISKERKELIDIWKKSLGIEERVVKLYENEYLFTECGNEYWVPVQKQVAGFFPQELKKDDMISLFIIRVGGVKQKKTGSWDWLFLSTEFEKYK